ncbi:MAG: alpha/beta hydrolase, partial [Anaerolineae bacterium]|nr:alpha/beta hydrolase [Anaerolineae bacterium]
LYVHETGTPGAPTVVFLHGVGASGWMWEKQAAALADFHCLAVDLPGHGRSNHEAWVSLADTANQIAEIIPARAAGGRAHVVGLSLGGYIALALLEQHADVLDRVVMSGVTVAPMPNRALLPLQAGLMSALLKRRWFVKMQARSSRLAPDMQAAFTENLLAMSGQAYRRIWKEGAYFHAPASLRYVNTPTLITAGGSESEIITRAVDVLSSLMPNAQGCFAPGLGHGWNVEAPDLFSAMVRAWITGAPLPARLQMAHGGNSAGR